MIELKTQREKRTVWFLSFWLSLIFFVILCSIARLHPFGTYSTETDFYHLYAPDAARLARWQFPENTFQAPGYPAALLVASTVGMDYFTAGKWLSVLCAPLIGVLTFALFSKIFGSWVGLGAQLLVYASTHFPRFAINATTDVFFLFLCLAAIVLFLNEAIKPRRRIALVAVLSSLAYLTRYNGVFLPATCLCAMLVFNFFNCDWRERLRLAAIYLAFFTLVSAPWFYANYLHNGSPFYNGNYLNMATEFYPQLAGDSTNQEGTRKLSLMFHSFADVLRYDPAQILRRYPENVYLNLRTSIVSGDLFHPLVGWLALLGLVLTFVETRTKEKLFLFSSLVFYFLIMSLTHWEARYYFFVMVLYAGFAVHAVARLFALIRSRLRLRSPALALAPVSLVLLMFWLSFIRARTETKKFLASHPTELPAACEYFTGENIHGSRLLSRKPHLAYFCAQEWVFFPTVKSMDELKEWIQQNPVDYVTISSVEISRRKELASLKDPRNAPDWLRPVWSSAQAPLVIYKVEREKLSG